MNATDNGPTAAPVRPLVVAVLLVALSGIGVLAFTLGHVVDSNRPASALASSPPAASAAASTSASASASASAASAMVAFADCASKTFGAPLGAQDAPTDLHLYAGPPPMQIDPAKLYQVVIHTARGGIVLCLQPNLAPKTVNNFVVLARNHYFDKIPFHRVVPGFVIQAGSPACKDDFTAPTCTGGGPGYQFADELPPRQEYVLGAVAMANSGPDTNGSQFFIDIADNRKGVNPSGNGLDPKYTLFGKVQSGMDFALQVKQGDVIQAMTVAEQR